MKKIILLLIITCSTILSYSQNTQITQDALNEIFIDLEGNEVTFASILDKNSGKAIYIDIWASWCKDCRKGLPGVKELQNQFENIQFVFLSLDKSVEQWKAGIEKLGISKGQHYFIKLGWKKSAFCKSIELDWIPRYMIVDSEGKIELYKAIETNDQKLTDKLKTIQ
ncbi:TlpA family protein disulfide reductase [Abyssalbus ytuae]|uniref:TlpA family protein disulfide reductase n=1 Tax=Abyssalbus ytuae TaxID=2926907 RepID=A0A9E6ZPU4_9FLAO|nr:TlpA disulfide reductase family protein [Abyssalbus ytuae]UOB16563.1 TlpA family protein disulfide reductase [Abyssalbus ytuae]